MLDQTTLERRRPYEANRQHLATAIQETVTHLDLAASLHLLTAAEDRLLHTFKRAFAAFQVRSSDVVAIGLLAETPAETAEAQALSDGKGQDAFDQADGTAQQLVTLLGSAEPSAEAVTAERGFPSVGTTAVYKIVVHGTDMTLTRTYIVLAESTHDGRPVHRVSDGEKMYLIDQATRNWTATLRAGKVRNAASPYVAMYAFPLWVGKSWLTTFTYADHERGHTFDDVLSRGTIPAYEDATVPAGTFKAFKLERRDPGTRRVVWYAPALHMPVKSSSERLPAHYLGPGKFTSELLEYVAK